jgi:hypothetical protein
VVELREVSWRVMGCVNAQRKEIRDGNFGRWSL